MAINAPLDEKNSRLRFQFYSLYLNEQWICVFGCVFLETEQTCVAIQTFFMCRLYDDVVHIRIHKKKAKIKGK